MAVEVVLRPSGAMATVVDWSAMAPAVRVGAAGWARTARRRSAGREAWAVTAAAIGMTAAIGMIYGTLRMPSWLVWPQWGPCAVALGVPADAGPWRG
jgi:hypothetical protein